MVIDFVSKMVSRSPVVLRSPFAVGAVLSLALELAGCGAGKVCEDLPRCVGDPNNPAAALVGGWTVKPPEQGGVQCQEMIDEPLSEGQLYGRPTPVARVPPVEQQNLDWCTNFALTTDTGSPIKNFQFWFPNARYDRASITYAADGKYNAGFFRTGRFSQNFSRTCLTQFGHPHDCTLLQQELTNLTNADPSLLNFVCSQDLANGGCNCDFDVFFSTGDTGYYDVHQDVITHYSEGTTAHFTTATFCRSGDTLSLSGANNSYLWGKPGLRTLQLIPLQPNCNDQMMGPGESGVDCGGLCPNPCM